MKADIKFANGAVKRCIGRVVDGQSVPWIDEADVRSHIAHINIKHPDVSIIRIVGENDGGLAR